MAQRCSDNRGPTVLKGTGQITKMLLLSLMFISSKSTFHCFHMFKSSTTNLLCSKVKWQYPNKAVNYANKTVSVYLVYLYHLSKNCNPWKFLLGTSSQKRSTSSEQDHHAVNWFLASICVPSQFVTQNSPSNFCLFEITRGLKYAISKIIAFEILF